MSAKARLSEETDFDEFFRRIGDGEASPPSKLGEDEQIRRMV